MGVGKLTVTAAAATRPFSAYADVNVGNFEVFDDRWNGPERHTVTTPGWTPSNGLRLQLHLRVGNVEVIAWLTKAPRSPSATRSGWSRGLLFASSRPDLPHRRRPRGVRPLRRPAAGPAGRARSGRPGGIRPDPAASPRHRDAGRARPRRAVVLNTSAMMGGMAFHLAQINIARLFAPLDRATGRFRGPTRPGQRPGRRRPRVRLAARGRERGTPPASPAFAWDTAGSHGVIVNMSVWTDPGRADRVRLQPAAPRGLTPAAAMVRGGRRAHDSLLVGACRTPPDHR